MAFFWIVDGRRGGGGGFAAGFYGALGHWRTAVVRKCGGGLGSECW